MWRKDNDTYFFDSNDQYYQDLFVTRADVRKGNKIRGLFIPDEKTKKTLRTLIPHLNGIYNKNQKQNIAYAFIENRNPILNAKQHIGYEYCLSFDLKNFFDSITYLHVKNYISIHCAQLCFIDGSPRQGLPTSPTISNIALIDFDNDAVNKLDELLIDYKITRYADDIIISFNNLEYLDDIKKIISDVVGKHNFELNRKKTKFQSVSNGRIIITGVSIDINGSIYPTRKLKRKLRAALHQKNIDSAIGIFNWIDYIYNRNNDLHLQQIQQFKLK